MRMCKILAPCSCAELYVEIGRLYVAMARCASNKSKIAATSRLSCRGPELELLTANLRAQAKVRK
jgi:hypothetical protein